MLLNRQNHAQHDRFRQQRVSASTTSSPSSPPSIGAEEQTENPAYCATEATDHATKEERVQSRRQTWHQLPSPVIIGSAFQAFMVLLLAGEFGIDWDSWSHLLYHFRPHPKKHKGFGLQMKG